MKAGKYWIGDLCYVLPREHWRALCALMGGSTSGEVKLPTGETVWWSQTDHGDGYYYDRTGRGYGVDSGTIGCILVDEIPPGKTTTEGHTHEFSKPFDCYGAEDNDGNIEIGHVVISTGRQVEDDEEEDNGYEEGDEEEDSDG